MMQGLYISATGLKTHGEGMNIVSNNIANVSTVGYKQQQWLFEDLIYQQVMADTHRDVGMAKKGMGSRVSEVRTLFTESGFEPGNANTDLALTGKGFFEVTDDKGNLFYTRAGNFRFDAEGVLRDPNKYAVSGIRIEKGEETGGLQPVQLDFYDEKLAVDPPKATTSVTALMNLSVPNDKVSDAANPYFSLLQAWDGSSPSPLTSTDYTQPLQVFDSQGVPHNVNVHFDATPSVVGGQKTLEYIVTIPPGEDAREGIAGTAGAGLLMVGTLTFSSAGELINMSAFTPTGGGDLKNLNNWTPAAIQDGSPVMTLNFAGQPAQSLAFNIGVSGGAWNGGAANAAAVGASPGALPSLTEPSYNPSRTTGFPTTSSLVTYQQDGYAQGDLNDLSVGEDGVITAHYSNGQTHDVYRIPVFRHTSEDGLRREGNNLYSRTEASGNMSHGVAGTENYSSIQGSYLENSNVDMAKEMVSMIIMQRGFQSNSKSITTLDTMIQKAIELKR